MRAPAEVASEIDRLVGELDKIDRALDGHTDDQGELQPGALDVLADAEDAWLLHRDARMGELSTEYEGRQLPGESKVDALTRAASKEAAACWTTFRHAQRLTRRLRERAERVQVQLSGRQTQSKLQITEGGAPDRRGLPVHGQRRVA